jgi:beta-lactamase class A
VPADGPAVPQLDWLIGVMNADPSAITADVLAPHFSAPFLAQVPADSLAGILQDLASQIAPLAVSSATPGPDGLLVVIVKARDEMVVRLLLGVAADGGPIGALLFQPAPELDPRLREFDAVAARLRTVAPQVSMLLSALDGSGCRPLHGVATAQARPLGSMFKLYVLGALVTRISAGQAQWTDLLPINDDWKSLPSGDLQDVPAGTNLSLRTYAEKMISISDNTAADHLIHFLGREQVEAQQAAMGHSNPALNIPFLTTRELFVIKLMLTADERAAYLAAPVAERRRLLDEVYSRQDAPPDLAARIAAWTAPRQIDSLEWFASAEDICRAQAWLQAAGQTPAGQPALAAMAINPGLNVNTDTFSYIGYKGGSEVGVITGSWLLQRRADAAWRVVTVMASDPSSPIAQWPVTYSWLAAVQLAGRE